MRPLSREMSAAEKLVLELIRAAARQKRVCPTNDIIAGRINAGPSRASNLITMLERRGLIVVHRYTASRIIVIPAEGLQTAGQPGNAHFRTRGTYVAPEREVKPVLLPSAWKAEPYVVVDRDPCFHCGARGDLGCEHQLASEPVEMA